MNGMMEWHWRSSEALEILIHLWRMYECGECEDIKHGKLLFIVVHIFSKYVLCYSQ
jgi:hypothetical protein